MTMISNLDGSGVANESSSHLETPVSDVVIRFSQIYIFKKYQRQNIEINVGQMTMMMV